MLRSSLLLLFCQAEFLFVGATFLIYSGAGRSGSFNLFDQAFLGFCVVTGFAQVWSIFNGLCPSSNYFLLCLTIILAGMKSRHFVDLLSLGLRVTRIRSALVLVPIGVAAAINSLTSGFCYDNALYHFLSVRWMAEYGSVPGLANLHGRLGFNSSLVALAGILSVPSGINIGREFVNGATTVLVAGILSQGFRFEDWRALNVSRNLYAFGLLAFVLMLVLSPCLSSPQPDVASAAVASASAWYFLMIVRFFNDDVHFGTNQWLLCVCASVATFEIKLSYFGFAASTILVALVIAARRRMPFRQVCLRLLFVLVLFIPWICCGYITSGCPFFPSDFGRLNFDWAVPRQLATFEKDAVFAWARAPGLAPKEVLGNWNWLSPWIVRILSDTWAVKPLLLGIVGFLLFLGRLVMQPPLQVERRWLVLLVPSAVGILFWFLTAPDPRFAQAVLWVFALNILLLPFQATNRARGLGILATFALAILASINAVVGSARLIKEKKRIPNIVQSQNELSARRTDSGLTVWTPKNAYEPGDSQLISTPSDRFNSRLELRGSSLHDGFRIRTPRG
ncbi:MAG: hypothetical protein JO066_15595 [Verrucomicrobia bacterium]|nr:hypothetical protein [Verrucomicrobiota bacterium]